MKKILLSGLVIVALVAGGLIYWLYSSLDSLVKTGIEKYGSEMMQVSVRVDKVKISVSDGEGKIYGLRVGNPKEFRSSHAFNAGTIDLQIDPSTVSHDVILVRKISVTAPDIVYETSNAGSNFDVIERNAESYLGPRDGSKPPKKLIVEHLLIRNGKVAYSPKIMNGKAINLSLPDIDLRNIGKAKGGVTPGELTQEIVNAMKTRFTKIIPDVAKAGADVVKGGVKSISQSIKGLFKK